MYFVIVEKELDDIDIDDIVNLEDLPELVFIDEDCGTSKAIDSLWRAWNISQTFYKPMDAQCVTNILGKSVSSISMWNIVNQLGKYDFLAVRFLLWVARL